MSVDENVLHFRGTARILRIVSSPGDGWGRGEAIITFRR